MGEDTQQKTLDELSRYVENLNVNFFDKTIDGVINTNLAAIGQGKSLTSDVKIKIREEVKKIIKLEKRLSSSETQYSKTPDEQNTMAGWIVKIAKDQFVKLSDKNKARTKIK